MGNCDLYRVIVYAILDGFDARCIDLGVSGHGGTFNQALEDLEVRAKVYKAYCDETGRDFRRVPLDHEVETYERVRNSVPTEPSVYGAAVLRERSGAGGGDGTQTRRYQALLSE